MEAEATIEQRENLAALNADRTDETEEYSSSVRQSDSATEKHPHPNAALIVILSMFALISDFIGIIPLVGQFVSLPVAAILRFARILGRYPNIVDNKPIPNLAYVLITFGSTKLSKKVTGKFNKRISGR
jgi:hypothetical protein